MENQEPIVIIGGGIGGLSAAVRLAVKNQSVVVIEKNPSVGGKMAVFHQDGFRWDTGPSVLTMLDVFEELFRSAGKNIDDFLQFIPMDPITSYFYPDGKQLDIWRDLSRTLQAIEKINPVGGEDYLVFLTHAAQQFRLTKSIFTFGPPPNYSSIGKLRFRDLLKIDVFRDLNAAVNDFTKLKFLQQIFTRFATYIGSDPYSAPAVLTSIAYLELCRGVWYPRGGVFSIAQALERLAIEKGVRILKSRSVSQIVVQDREVRGVILDDGSSIETNIVISNVDIATTYATLLPQKPPYTWVLENYQKNPSSSSAFVLLLGIKGRFSKLSHHNIFFSDDNREEFNQLFKLKVPPENPTLNVSITSKSDSNHAPSGCENWFIMANVPPLDEKFDWINQAEAYKNVILKKIKKMGFDLEGKILVEKVITPIELEAFTGAYKGSLYGMAFTNWQTAFRRPKPDPKSPAGLYFIGGTTHPGGGVPMVALSAKYVSNLVIEKQSKL